MFRWFKLQLSRLNALISSPKKRQVAGICWRPASPNGFEVLLITTRRTGRWTPPKGNIEKGQTPQEAVAMEAWEEAGVRGVVSDQPIGAYTYLKFRKKGRWRKLAVDVYTMEVRETFTDFPERDQRRQRWTSQKIAAASVRERRLKRLIRNLRLESVPPVS